MKKKVLYLVFAAICFLSCKNNVFANTIKNEDIPSRSYVIGTHLFTREENENTGYSGQLTTKFIMLAADTINSQNIDDMMIYYKNAKSTWIDGLSGEEVEVPANFEITNINAGVYLAKPITIAGGSGNYENGYYIHEIQIQNVFDYCEPNEVENYRFETYEIINGEKVKLTETLLNGEVLPLDYSIIGGVIGTPTIVQVEAGKSRTFVTRVYTVEGNQNNYSDYSEEIVIDRTAKSFAKPTIEKQFYGFDSENNSFYYGINVTNLNDYRINNNLLITGYELYKKVDDDYETVKDQDVNGFRYDIYSGEKVELAIRVYVVDSQNNKIYSEYSDSVVLDETNTNIAKPVLDIKNVHYDDTAHSYYGYLSIVNKNDYQKDNYYNISGVEIYETAEENDQNLVQIGDSYFKLSERFMPNIPQPLNSLDFSGGSFGLKFTTYITRVYITKKDGTKIYSDYSEPVRLTKDLDGKFMVTTNTKPEKPEIDYVVEKIANENLSSFFQEGCTNKECGFIYINLNENQYKNTNGNYNINGVEFYIKSDEENEHIESVIINNERFINTQSHSYQNSLEFSNDHSTPEVITEKYAVRTYVLDSNNEKIYSDPEFITIDSYEEYSKTVYNDTLQNTLGQLAYTLSDVDGDGQQELILRGPFSKTVGSQIAYKIYKYSNGNTYLYKNLERDEIDVVGYDNYYNDRVYQNNDNSLILVNGVGGSDGGVFFVQQEVDRITFNPDFTVNENRTFTNIPSESDFVDFSKLEQGDTLLTFYKLNDKEYLNDIISNQNILSKFEEIIDTHYNNFKYGYADINGDGIQELIVKTLYGKDLNVNYQVYTYEFTNGLNGFVYNRIYYTNRNSGEILVPTSHEHYLYKDNNNTLSLIYKVNNNQEEVTSYAINDEHILTTVGEGTHEIINGQMSTGDHLITFNSYVNENKGC